MKPKWKANIWGCLVLLFIFRGMTDATAELLILTIWFLWGHLKSINLLSNKHLHTCFWRAYYIHSYNTKMPKTGLSNQAFLCVTDSCKLWLKSKDSPWICSHCQTPNLYCFTPCSAFKHAWAVFTRFGYCSVSTLTSKKAQSAQWKVKVVGPCVQSDKDSQDGRDTGPHSAHNNVSEWNNESMEKTHNLHYKGFGILLYDTCDW